MAYPTQPQTDLDQPEPLEPRPRAPLAVAGAISVLATFLAVLDVMSPLFTIPCPADHGVIAGIVAPWIIYGQARSHHLLKRRMGAVEWADGFVHGVARRTPPNERVRWMDD